MNEMNKTMLVRPWHALNTEEVFRNLNSNEEGLSNKEARLRLKKFGQNILIDKNGDKIFVILWNQFRNPLIYILVIASAVSLLLMDFLNSAIIATAVVLNAAVGFFQELKVSNILKELKKAISYRANVIRGGQSKQIDSKDVTVGDVLVLRQGDKVPADARIIRLTNFKTNEASLTGESDSVEKSLSIMDEETSVADRQNMVFMGTFVEEGFAEAIVVSVGSLTEFGNIASLIEEGRGEDITPLQKKFALFGKQLAIFFLLISAGLFMVGLLWGINIFIMFLTAVAVAVAAVPEGLPIALSVTLAVGSRRILAKGGLVRKMVAAEALGNTTVIAADKTSTLTEGKMKITQIFTSEGRDILRENFSEVIRRDKMSKEYLSLKLAALLSDAFIENPHDKENDWKVYGRPVDRAILLTLARSGLEIRNINKEMPRLDELLFAAEYRYSAVLNKFDDKNNIISILGAPETILEISNYPEKVNMYSKTRELAGQGLRVMAVGFKFVDSAKKKFDHSDINNLTFLSLIVFSDPIREEVKEAIEKSRSAGLRTIIITGDHLLTAEYIAKELGILMKEGRIIEGKDMPTNLSSTVVDYDVFARVTPEDKVRIVDALKEKGEVVAMIGDGINDAPALLKSDIGIAVGSGTDVAKEASDLILINDSFAIVIEAIKQGRIILDNIRKVIIFVISNAFSEVILISGSIILGLPLALLPVQILWVNLIVDGIPSLALAFEKEERVMARKPEKEENIFTRDSKKLIAIFVVITDLALFALYYYSLRVTNDIDYARTMAFVGLGLTSLFYIFSVKTLRLAVWQINPFSNNTLNIGVLIGLGLYVAAIYFEFLRNILGTVVLSISDWYILAALGLFNIVVIELGKFVFLNRKKHI